MTAFCPTCRHHDPTHRPSFGRCDADITPEIRAWLRTVKRAPGGDPLPGQPDCPGHAPVVVLEATSGPVAALEIIG